MAYSFRSTLAPGPVGGNPGAPINPIGIPGGGLVLSIVGTIGYVAFCVAIFGSVVSLIVRFRRARLVERQQLKWLSSAAVLVGMTVLFGLLVDAVWGETGWATNVSNGTLTGSLVCVPVAVGIAVLRYRLYEIDRLISRTLVYASLTVVLGLGYAGRGRAVPASPASHPSDRRPALQPAPLQRRQDDRGVQRSTARRD